MNNMKTLTLFLISFNALAVNFAFVQKTNGSGSLTQVFSSGNTAHSAIVAVIYDPGGTPTVSDSNMNSYTLIHTSGGFPGELLFVALNVIAGANTVTASGGGGLIAMEYSSATATYYACVAHMSSSPPGVITNPSFGSALEVEMVWGGTFNGSNTAWSSATGTVRLASTMPFNFTTSVGAGDDNVSSMSAGTYTNTIKINSTQPASETVSAVFLNLDNPTCASSVGGTTTFSVIY